MEAAINKNAVDDNEKMTMIIDRNELAATLITKLSQRLHQHQNEGLITMVNEWAKQDY